MKMCDLVRPLGLATLLLLQQASFGQSSPEDATHSNKVESPSIFESARLGNSQDLLIEFEVGTLEADSARARLKNATVAEEKRRKISGALNSSQMAAVDRNAALQDDAETKILRQKLRAFKDAAFPSGRLLDATILRDYETSPIVLVRVPNLRSLIAILSLPSVKQVSVNTLPLLVPTGQLRTAM